MNLRAPSIHLVLTVALLASAVALRIADPDPIGRLRLSVFDSYLALAPRPLDPALPVRIVDIDEASLAAVGQWPWPRTHLARIIAALKQAGARTISLDLILAEPDRLSPSEFAKLFKDTPQLAPMIGEASALPSNDQRLAARDRSRSRCARHRRRAGTARRCRRRARTLPLPAMIRKASCRALPAASRACRS